MTAENGDRDAIAMADELIAEIDRRLIAAVSVPAFVIGPERVPRDPRKSHDR